MCYNKARKQVMLEINMYKLKSMLLVGAIATFAISTAIADGTIRFEGRIVEDTALVEMPSNQCIETQKQDKTATSESIVENCLNQNEDKATLDVNSIDKNHAVILVSYS